MNVAKLINRRSLKGKAGNPPDGVWIFSAIPFFVFGWFFYFIIPFIALRFIDYSLIVDAASPYIQISFFDIYYWMDCIVVLFSFLLGYFVAGRLRLGNKSWVEGQKKSPAVSKIIFFILSLYLGFHVALSILTGASFFSGYENYDISVLGPIATILYTAVFFSNFFINKKRILMFRVLFAISSVLMFGLGSRMFSVLGLISIFLKHVSENRQILKKISVYAFISVLVLFVLAAGALRQGDEISIKSLIDIAIAEPLFTASSTAVYFSNMGGRPILAFPADIIASVINFVPSALFPSKLELMEHYARNQYIFSPFGANGLLGNLYSNFGIFYPLFMLLIGFFYGYIKNKARKLQFYRAVYITLLPLLMFHFMREGFITVVKVMFFNGWIFPGLCLFLASLIVYRKPVKKLE